MSFIFPAAQSIERGFAPGAAPMLRRSLQVVDTLELGSQISRRQLQPLFPEGSGPTDYVCAALTLTLLTASLVFYIWLYRSLLRSGKQALASTPFANEDTLGLTPKAVIVGFGRGVAGGVKAICHFLRSPRAVLRRSRDQEQGPDFVFTTSQLAPSQPPPFLQSSTAKSLSSLKSSRSSTASPIPPFAESKGISVTTSLHTYDDGGPAMEMGELELPVVLDLTPNGPFRHDLSTGQRERADIVISEAVGGPAITRPPPGLMVDSLRRALPSETPYPRRI